MKETARQPGKDFMQATPRDWTIGKIADAFSATGSPERNQYIRMLANAFGLPAVGQTLDRISYGEPLTTGAGGIGGTTRPRPEAVEAAMVISPFAAKFAQATRGMPVGMSIKDVSKAFPQEDAFKLAQQRAALPVEKGGLGLPANNTAAERAAAMGFDTPSYHGTNKTFDSFKVGKGGVDELGAGVYTTEVPYAANMYASGKGGNVVPVLTKSSDVFDRANLSPESFKQIAKRIKANPENLPPLVRGWADESLDDLAAYIQKTSANGGLNTWIERAGFIGAKDATSQIPKQQATFNPENIRSRFAAFDPFRKTAATAATMGVAAPDLLAAESQPTKTSDSRQLAQMLQDIGTDPQTIYQRTGLIKTSGQWQ